MTDVTKFTAQRLDLWSSKSVPTSSEEKLESLLSKHLKAIIILKSEIYFSFFLVLNGCLSTRLRLSNPHNLLLRLIYHIGACIWRVFEAVLQDCRLCCYGNEWAGTWSLSCAVYHISPRWRPRRELLRATRCRLISRSWCLAYSERPSLLL